MPRYSKEFITEIKSRLRVSEVVGKFVKLTQRGNEYVGLSPFKNEKTPSFTVNDDKEFFHCFSSAEHGDIFSFLMKHKNMSYPDSIEYLAKQAGLNPESGIIKDSNYVENNYASLRNIMIEANKFYTSMLKKSEGIKKYLDKRQVNRDMWKKFELGFAGSQNNELYIHLKKIGVNIEDALSLGLIKKSKHKENEYYDFFRNRLMFPIKDYKSNLIAFGGRAIDNSNIKYINSSDSPIFKKSFNLFNLNLAIEENRKVEDLIIVEGYMDVISLFQNNFKTAVAPLGTALTSYQLQRAWKVCNSPIIMFDGDEAGQKAAERAAVLALSNISPDLSARFCILPSDYDPDDFLLKNSSEEFKKILNKSYSLSEFIWMVELEKEDISTPEKKAGFEKRIKAIISKIQNQTVRDYYIKEFNDKINILKRSQFQKNSSYSRYIDNRVSKEIYHSERLNQSSHDSVIREKIILMHIIENPLLLSKYIEELGRISFNDLKLAKLVSQIIKFCSINSDKDLESFDLKSYLLRQGLTEEIESIYKSNLLKTYRLAIKSDFEIVENSFLGLLDLHKQLLEKKDLSQAFRDLEQNMDQESYENFLKIKKESLAKN
ncbi:DNA primase [Pelagibacterales bacterium SAG-MED32]|nr:DNA primase [Pelagibacterales bacterium SAG-MED32]